MLPLYIWIMVFVGTYTGTSSQQWSSRQWYHSVEWIALISALVILGAIALIQLLEFPFRTTASHDIFRLAVINAKGQRANRTTLLWRWAIVWLPLFLPMLFVALLIKRTEPTAAFISALVILVLWISAAVYAVIHPNRGLHDRLAGTWVVRR